jgi:hypothetical protein
MSHQHLATAVVFIQYSMMSIKKTITRHTKRQKQNKIKFEGRQSRHCNQTQMLGVLELSDYEFKTTVNKMLRSLMDKEDSMQEQIDHGSREIESLRKNQKKC